MGHVSQTFSVCWEEADAAFFFSTLENVIHYGKAGQLSFKGETRKGGRLIRAVVVGGLPGGGV